MEMKRETRRVRKFTPFYVKTRKPEARAYVIWAPNGLGLRVRPSGARSWIYAYHLNGRFRWMTLGRYPEMTVAKAHKAHGAAMSNRDSGIDPGSLTVAANIANRAAATVAELADQFLTLYSKPRKKSAFEDERLLRVEVLPHLGTMRAADVRRRDVLALLDGIVARGAGVTANRVLAVLRKAYNWGISRELVEFSPCAQVPRPTVEHERERFLSADELKRFLIGIEAPDLFEFTKTTKHALRFQLATGSRPGEAAGATWQEFDLQAGVWTIPAERTKTHHEHTIPLSRYARQVLAEVRLLDPLSAHPFPGRKGPMLPATMSTAINGNLAALKLERFTPHDLRRSCATHLASLGHSRVVISRILGHALPGVTRIYDRHSYADEMRAALEEWGAVLDRLSRPAEPEAAKRRARK
jgi:integrase